MLTTPVELRRSVPDGLLSCAGRPPDPDVQPLLESHLAAWIVDWEAAWADCSDRLGELRRLLGDAPVP